MHAEAQGHGYTACIKGDPIGAAGVVMREGDTGEAWALFSPAIKYGFGKSLFKAVRHGMAEIIAETQPKKLYALVDPADETAARFMIHLNFQMAKHLYELEIRGQ